MITGVGQPHYWDGRVGDSRPLHDDQAIYLPLDHLVRSRGDQAWAPLVCRQQHLVSRRAKRVRDGLCERGPCPGKVGQQQTNRERPASPQRLGENIRAIAHAVRGGQNAFASDGRNARRSSPSIKDDRDRARREIQRRCQSPQRRLIVGRRAIRNRWASRCFGCLSSMRQTLHRDHRSSRHGIRQLGHSWVVRHVLRSSCSQPRRIPRSASPAGRRPRIGERALSARSENTALARQPASSSPRSAGAFARRGISHRCRRRTSRRDDLPCGRMAARQLSSGHQRSPHRPSRLTAGLLSAAASGGRQRERVGWRRWPTT